MSTMERYIYIIVVIVGATIISTQAKHVYKLCQSGYSYIVTTDKCYRAYIDTDSHKTWYDARKHCQRQAADLVVIPDKLLSRNDLTDLVGNTPRFWLGLQELAAVPDSDFVWVDSSSLSLGQSSKFGNNQPSSSNVDDIDCVEQIYDGSEEGAYVWNVTSCLETIPYICEKSRDIYPACPSRFTYHVERQKCIFSTTLTFLWDDVINKCRHYGANLVVIPDSAYNTFIKEFFSLKDASSYWIGLRSAKNRFGSYEFQWVDGKPLRYSDWHTGEADYSGFGPFDDSTCGAFGNSSGSFRWEEKNCDTWEGRGICETYYHETVLCPGGDWTLNTRNRQCYKVQTKAKTFDESRERCRQDGGDLVTITDAETKEFVIDLIQPKIEETPRYWVGLQTSNSGHCIIEWVDGSCLDVAYLDGFQTYESKRCGTFRFKDAGYIFSDFHCDNNKLPSICQRNALRGYPVFECPHGYVSYISLADRRIMCLTGRSEPATWSTAVNECTNLGGELFTAQYQDTKLIRFLKNNLFRVPIWDKRSSCGIVDLVSNTFKEGPCDKVHPYICLHWGYIRSSVINLKQVAGLIRQHDFVFPDDENHNAMLVSDLCKASSMTELYTMHDWASTPSSSVTITTAINFIQRVTDGRIDTCDIYDKEPCCVLVNLNSKKLQTEISFPMDKILCVCPDVEPLPFFHVPSDTHDNNIQDMTNGIRISTEAILNFRNTATPRHDTAADPIKSTTEAISNFRNTATTKHDTADPIKSTTEAMSIFRNATTPKTNSIAPIETTREPIHFFRNMTTPQNNSTAPNNLCSCRCDSMNVDFNLTSQVLDEMILTIQKELKVDTNQLSSKRNKKISAPDSRPESQSIGYVGLILVLIPVCLMVGLDLTSIFKTK